MLFRNAVPILIALALPVAASAQSFTHVHLRAPDAAAAAEWYHTLLGGDLRPSSPGMGSVGQAHGAIATMFDDGSAAPSRGGVIDHFGFAVPDVAVTLQRAQIMGARIVAGPTPGVVTTSIAMIEDPWGTRVELLETAEFRGIQHVHLVSEEPAVLRDWLLDVFGGVYEPVQGGSELHAIQYDGIWIYVTEPLPDPEPEPDSEEAVAAQPEAPITGMDMAAAAAAAAEMAANAPPVAEGIAPSRGRALDHLGFAVDDMTAFVERLRASGYEPYVTRPNRPGGTTLLVFFEGADGVHFEIAQPNGVP